MPKKRRKTQNNNNFTSKYEERFAKYWKTNYEIPCVRQHKFNPNRQWAFDFAWPNLMIAMEIQGYGRGHASYESMLRDYNRLNYAQSVGWKVYYFMGVHFQPTRIGKTCDYILSRLEEESVKRSQSDQTRSRTEPARRLRHWTERFS